MIQAGSHRRRLVGSVCFLSLVTLGLQLAGCRPHHVVPADRVHTQAILVLPGLGMKGRDAKGARAFGRVASEEGYDLYLADYRSRKTVEEGTANLARFITTHKLEQYEALHVFAFILGGFTLNVYLREHKLENLKSVVYDRSPLQERAPHVASTGWMALPVRIVAGRVVADLAGRDYPVLPRADVRVGLMIEGRATRFIRSNKKRALAMGPLEFSCHWAGQRFDACTHLWLDHLDMYNHYDEVGPELLHFFQHGTFTPQARQVPFDKDPFSKQ